MNAEQATELIRNTRKIILLTIGFRWKNPTVIDRLIPKETALALINSDNYPKFDIKEEQGTIYLNVFTYSDMW